MTREDVEERLERFLELVDRQQEVREELLALKMHGHRATEEEVSERVARHQELIQEIDSIRQEKMLPILEELTRFIASVKVDNVAD